MPNPARGMLFMALLAGCLAAASGCSMFPVLPVESSAKAATIDEAIAQGGVAWSTRRLSWSDYRGTPPAGGLEDAATVSSLLWGFQCKDGVFDFHVVAAFFPARSWVKSSLMFNPWGSQPTLVHEWTHFDLSEIYARLMRRSFSTLERPCDLVDDELNALGARFEGDEASAQRQYDVDTENGQNVEIQAQWEDKVAHLLEALPPAPREDTSPKAPRRRVRQRP